MYESSFGFIETSAERPSGEYASAASSDRDPYALSMDVPDITAPRGMANYSEEEVDWDADLVAEADTPSPDEPPAELPDDHDTPGATGPESGPPAASAGGGGGAKPPATPSSGSAEVPDPDDDSEQPDLQDAEQAEKDFDTTIAEQESPLAAGYNALHSARMLDDSARWRFLRAAEHLRDAAAYTGNRFDQELPPRQETPFPASPEELSPRPENSGQEPVEPTEPSSDETSDAHEERMDSILNILQVKATRLLEEGAGESAGFGESFCANGDEVVDALKTAGVRPGIRVLDLGGGLGPWATAAALLGGEGKSIEHNPALHYEAGVLLDSLRDSGELSQSERSRIELVCDNFFEASIDAEVIAVYPFYVEAPNPHNADLGVSLEDYQADVVDKILRDGTPGTTVIFYGGLDFYNSDRELGGHRFVRLPLTVPETDLPIDFYKIANAPPP